MAVSTTADASPGHYQPQFVPVTEISPQVSRGCQPVPHQRLVRDVMMTDQLRFYFAQKHAISLAELPPDDERLKEVPRRFHSIMPLDDPNVPRGAAGSCGFPTSVYKVVDSRSGYTFALRRIDNVRIDMDTCTRVLTAWRRVRHPNVIPLRDASVQHRAIYLVHDYFPGAKTLRQIILEHGPSRPFDERTIFSIAIQLLTAIRAIHEADMACMSLNITNVLLTGAYRARISNMGVSHIVDSEARGMTLADHKREDILSLSKLLIMLGTMSLHALQNLSSSVKVLESRYSPDFCKFALLPLRRASNAYDMLALSYKGLLTEVDLLYSHADALEEQLATQFESDRMFRLLAKLGLINERPDGISAAGGNTWSETGDRYILKLFRDYVFTRLTTGAGQRSTTAILRSA